ncbi:MAG: SulP family inorganic anion transporter [Candidatus Kapabacteria bacterium]|nr:SulP family inorganic anion transporter [Candidatus Kapabacteria bacterium]
MQQPFALFKTNLSSGIVVCLVALPLCLGIAIASGAPPLSGIIAGIIGGIVVGVISNSHLSVSGPAAGLTAVVLSAIATLGSFELFLCSVVIAGVIQTILGILRAGTISNYFPNNVIEGMLAGIGIIIIRKQIPHAIGYDIENMVKEETIFDSWHSLIDFFTGAFDRFHWGVILIFFLSVCILTLWSRYKLHEKMKLLPGALVAVFAGVLLNEFVFTSNEWLVIRGSLLVNLPALHGIQEITHVLVMPDFSGLMRVDVWTIGLTVAAIASIETLLSIEAADKLDSLRRVTDTNIELIAQGAGNIISAMVGGLPMTSVVLRSSANANAGATHKTSTIIHGVLLLFCMMALPALLNKIPRATLAAILILIGYKLAKPSLFNSYWRKGKYQFIPFIITVIAVVLFDILRGVGLGLLISLGFVLREHLRKTYYISKEELESAGEIRIHLGEEVSFLNKAAIKRTLYNIPSNTSVILDATRTTYIAADVLDIIEEFVNYRAKELNINVQLVGLNMVHIEQSSAQHPQIEIIHKRTL